MPTNNALFYFLSQYIVLAVIQSTLCNNIPPSRVVAVTEEVLAAMFGSCEETMFSEVTEKV